MNEVHLKILLLCVSLFLLMSGCASINTSSEVAEYTENTTITETSNRAFFPEYGLSVTKPSGDWITQKGLGQDELVLWINSGDGSLIEIMASRSSRHLSYHDIAVEFTEATCNLISQQIPLANCKLIEESKVQFDEKTFYKAKIFYQPQNARWSEEAALYLYKTIDYVFHFIFMKENHDIYAPQIMSSLVFFEDDQYEKQLNNITDKTSMIDACYLGETDIVTELLAVGGNVNSTNEDGVSALSYAADRGHIEIVEILLTHGANVNARSNIGSTPLMNAAFMGHLKIVRLLIEHGADIKAQSEEGTTALMNAAANGHIDIVKILLAKGANLNACEVCGLTALWNAISGGYTDIVELLIEYGADINLKANDGSTALMNAVFTGNTGMVKMLIQAGAEVNTQSHNGLTALMIAERKGYKEISRMLKEAGAVEQSLQKSVPI